MRKRGVLRYTKRITTVLEPDAAEKLANIAEEKGVSTSHLVRDCVEQQLGQLQSEGKHRNQVVSI